MPGHRPKVNHINDNIKKQLPTKRDRSHELGQTKSYIKRKLFAKNKNTYIALCIVSNSLD